MRIAGATHQEKIKIFLSLLTLFGVSQADRSLSAYCSMMIEMPVKEPED
jgi:hypothetical protein